MRHTNGLNLETGEFESIQDARAKPDNPTKAERYSHIFNCLNSKCSATYHFRKAVAAKENTDPRPSTFVHNYLHPHVAGCRFDYKKFVRQHREVDIDTNDTLNLRLSFPLGGAYADLHPSGSGVLSHAQKQVANDNINKMGFSSLRKLTDFIEQEMGGLKDPMLGDLKLSNQGEKREWTELWTPPSQYFKLLEKAKQQDSQQRPEAAFTLVQPLCVDGKTNRGNIRFVCKPEYTVFESEVVQVKPILVLYDDSMVSHFQRVAQCGESVLVASRPLHSVRPLSKVQNVYLPVASTNQLARVDNQYWEPLLDKGRQFRIAV